MEKRLQKHSPTQERRTMWVVQVQRGKVRHKLQGFSSLEAAIQAKSELLEKLS